MSIKTACLIGLMTISCSAWAQDTTTSPDALLTAQLAYQQALKEQKQTIGQVGSLKQQLELAQQRLNGAQADVTRIQNQLNDAQTAENNSNQALQAASQQLDAAWSAARQTQ